MLVGQGGTGVLAETPEIYGAEHLLRLFVKLPELLANVLQGGDLLVTQGAGNVGGIARELAARIEPTDGHGGAHGR